MKIRPATTTDIPAYLQLNKKLNLENTGSEESGFLLPTSQKESDRLFANSTILVAEIKDQLIGVITGYDKNSPLYQDLTSAPGELKWTGKNPLVLEKNVYVHNIAVDKDFRAGGTAEKLFLEFCKYFPEAYFWAAIVEAPFKNLRSAAVMRRFGLKRVGQFNAETCFGLKNYQSGIYLRERK